jgi:hypothetical protein
MLLCAKSPWIESSLCLSTIPVSPGCVHHANESDPSLLEWVGSEARPILFRPLFFGAGD